MEHTTGDRVLIVGAAILLVGFGAAFVHILAKAPWIAAFTKAFLR